MNPPNGANYGDLSGDYIGSRTDYTRTPQSSFWITGFTHGTQNPTLQTFQLLGVTNGRIYSQIITREWGSSKLYSLNVASLLSCYDNNECVSTYYGYLVHSSTFILNMYGLNGWTPPSTSLSFKIAFPTFYTSTPTYFAIGITRIDAESNIARLGLDITNIDKQGFTIQIIKDSASTVHSIFYSYIISSYGKNLILTSKLDGFQSYLYDFTNHTFFNSVFNSQTNLRSLQYDVYFKQSYDLEAELDVTVIFSDIGYSSSAGRLFIKSNYISRASEYVTIEIVTNYQIVFTNLKGYVLIYNKYSRYYGLSGVKTTLPGGTDLETSSGTRFVSRNNYFPDRNYPFFPIVFTAITSIDLELTVRSTIGMYPEGFNTAGFARGINVKFYGYYDAKIYGMEAFNLYYYVYRTSTNLMTEQSLYGPKADVSQTVYLWADFISSRKYALLISDLALYQYNTIQFASNSFNTNPKIFRILPFINTTYYNSSAMVTPFNLPQAATLSFFVLQLIQSSDWMISGYSSANFDGFAPQVASTATLNGNFITWGLRTYSTILANKIFYHDANVNFSCRVEINFTGIIRGVYVQNYFMLSGSSIDTNTTIILSSLRRAYLQPGEYVYLTVTGYMMMIYSFSFIDCKDEIGNPITVSFTDYIIEGLEISRVNLVYTYATTSCPSDCKACLSSSYCLVCNTNYYQLEGACVTICSSPLTKVNQEQFCDSETRNHTLRNSYSIDSNATFNGKYLIDVYQTESNYLIFFFPYKVVFENLDIFLPNSSIGYLPELQLIRGDMTTTTTRFTLDISSKLIFSLNETAEFSLFVYDYTTGFFRVSESNDSLYLYGSKKSFRTIGSLLSLLRNKFYRIEFLLECYSSCRLQVNFNGNLMIFANERTQLFNATFYQTTQYTIYRNLTGNSYFTMKLQNSTSFSFSIQGSYQIFAINSFLFEDYFTYNSSDSCNIDGCINCYNNSFCLSCEYGRFLIQNQERCYLSCQEQYTPNDIEGRCICFRDEHCPDPAVSRCDYSTGLCQSCISDRNCIHIFAAGYSNCINNTCINCPLNCMKCANSSYCLQCISGFNATNGICIILCEPGLKRTSNSTCDEYCGDGIKSSAVKRISAYCDDGNNRNGDGCSSLCVVEDGYQCHNGSSVSRDYCFIRPYMKILGLSSENSFLLMFSHAMNISGDLGKYSNLRLSTDTSSIPCEFIQLTNDSYQMNVFPKNPISGETLILEFTSPEYVVDIYKGSINETIYTINVELMRSISSGEIQTAQAVGKATSTISQVSISSSVPAIFSGANPIILWSLINLLQIYYYLLLINVDFPYNAQEFFSIFNIGNFNFLPNPVSYIFENLENYSIEGPKKFKLNNQDGLFLINAGSMLCFVLVLYGIYGALVTSRWLWRKIYHNDPKIIKILMNYLEWSGVIDIWTTSYLNLTIAAFLQMRMASFQNTPNIVSFFSSVVVGIINLGILFFMFKKIRGMNTRPAIIRFQYGTLVNDFKIRPGICKYYNLILLARKFLMSAVLVSLHDHPYTEIISLISIHMIPALFLIGYSPFKNKREAFINGIEEFCFLMINVIILMLMYDNKNTIFEDVTRSQYGWAIIFLVSISLLASISGIFYEQYQILKHLYIKFKNRSVSGFKKVKMIRKRNSKMD